MATTKTSTITAIKINQACTSGKSFAELFYEKLDKSRHSLGSLFHDSAILIWNGHQQKGKPAILSFFDQLPTSTTSIFSIDAQPVEHIPAEHQATILVTCSGKMLFNGETTKFFHESFMLSAQNNTWKIVTETYRSF